VFAPPLPRLCAGIAIDALDGKDEPYKKLGELFGSHFEVCNGPSIPRLGIKVPYSPDRANPPSYDAIYFVCHGYYDSVRPVDSGLLVSNPVPVGTFRREIRLPGFRKSAFRDLPFRELPREVVPRSDIRVEVMTIGELEIEGFTQAELVAVLGCSTGAGQISYSDRMESMGHQWLNLGAASTLGSQWSLDIEFVSAFVDIFLKHWLDFRQPKALALRECLRSMLSGPDPTPLYQWAAVQLMGDWL